MEDPTQCHPPGGLAPITGKFRQSSDEQRFRQSQYGETVRQAAIVFVLGSLAGAFALAFTLLAPTTAIPPRVASAASQSYPPQSLAGCQPGDSGKTCWSLCW